MSDANIDDNRGVSPARGEPNHLRRVIIIWVVLSIVMMILAALLTPLILPSSASTLDGTDNFTIVMLTVLAMPVALFVFVFLGYSMIVFRVRGRPTEDGLDLHPTQGLQLSWLGITSVLCLFLLIWGLVALYQESTAVASNTLVVRVTAQQWYWSFYYPEYHMSSQGQVIELPVNRPVQFLVTSEDVLHGFSIRDLGVRVDANPGEVTSTVLVTPTQIGGYTVNCVELCGLYHSYMWEAVNVVDGSTFNAWVVSQGGTVPSGGQS